ncbi:cobalamin-dependent protein [Streptomyces sp. SL13]|uniref:Cobalamin-dependent protein n=1 Tax=Streptantibioticus silvisoli TaxID=2705255 RepID=A0AA90K848_9ACTN|nr:cobalamin-dependent protein [Streptantibioticus silvisoli]MDI5964396.1 cobalamin-dependent protein [Streptantibioticus silvisoli]MDI5969042.1 cobalamin-dependent protein [Streptantibioticus silvisoli]
MSSHSRTATATGPAAAEPGRRTGGDDLLPWTRCLWRAVDAGDEQAALDIVGTALSAGIDPEAVLLDVVGAVQRRVGEEWAANRMSVTREHLATAINDRAVAALAQHPAARRPDGAPSPGRATVACVDGEWHALPARMLAEVLRLRGWRVDYLGAQVPARHLVPHLHLTDPDVLLLSGSLATRLPAAHATITACQAAGVPVMAGGAAFGPGGRYARLLGADAWAPDARSAADRLTADPLLPIGSDRTALDDLPHLADHEYALVTQTSTTLVREMLAGLEERVPAVRESTATQRRHTAEDLGHLVGYLAAALYVDDDDLFEAYLAWSADVLTARRVAADSLPLTLDLLAGRLKDLPRATRIIAAGRSTLAPAAAASGGGTRG